MARQNQMANMEMTQLPDVLTGDFLKFCAENCTPEALKQLPEGQQSEEYWKQNIYSPQFMQAIELFDNILNSENTVDFFRELGLDQSILKDHFGTDAFLRALIKWGKQKQPESK